MFIHLLCTSLKETSLEGSRAGSQGGGVEGEVGLRREARPAEGTARVVRAGACREPGGPEPSVGRSVGIAAGLSQGEVHSHCLANGARPSAQGNTGPGGKST